MRRDNTWIFLPRGSANIDGKQVFEVGSKKPAGHSLGGAVAQICALDLLHAAPPHRPPQLQAIGFAAPAIGNQALAAFVERKGWQQRLTNYLLPGEILAHCPPSQYLTPGAVHTIDVSLRPQNFVDCWLAVRRMRHVSLSQCL